MGGIVPVQQGLGNYLALDEDKSSATNTAFFIYVVIWRGTSEQ